MLSGCSSGIGDRIRSWLPGRSAQATEAPARPSANSLPPGDVSGRVARLEAGVVQLQREFDELKPSIQHLVEVEDDLDELVAQLFTIVAPPAPGAAPANPPAMAPPAPATPAPAAAPANAPPPSPPPMAGAAPLSLLPSQALRPASGAPVPATAVPTPVQPAAVPAAPPAAIAAPPAPQATPANAFALHLASFRTREKLTEGWADVAAKVPGALQGLRGGAAQFDKPGDGRYYRLNAGPVASRADAETRCRAIQNAGLYCAVLPYAGTTPL
jgi:hypothetical protein